MTVKFIPPATGGKIHFFDITRVIGIEILGFEAQYGDKNALL